MSIGSEALLERVRAATADEYTIESEIGRGGMAAVFRARDIALHRRVAIKVMLPDLVDVAGTQDRFVIEAKTAAHLDHPGIVSVYAVKQRAGLLFIVMKYLEGHTLEEVMREPRAHNPAVVTAIVRQVAEALHFAHSEGVVHRDVKPGNIIVDARGRPVVTDFGIAKVASARSITVAGSMLGTPTYMSPEQCRGLPATAASDQYALGVMAYEMLAGRTPFSGSMFELIHAHTSAPPQPLGVAVPGIDPALEETVMRMLSKNPSDRWASLGEVAQRLGGNVRRPSQPPEVSGTIPAFAGGEQTLAFDPGAVTVGIPAPAPEAVTTPIRAVSLVTGDAPGRDDVTIIAPGAVPVASDAAPAPRSAMPRGVAYAGIAIMIVVAAVLFIPRSLQNPAVVEPAKPAEANPVPDSAQAATRDTAPPARATQPPQAQQPGKAAAPPVPDSSRVAAARRDSARAQCPGLLERISLGEKLTDAETARFRRLCTK